MTGQCLFGGDDTPWKSDEWTASDDRVRGGSSQSYFEVNADGSGRVHGNLDITTLGGAGFASQRAIGNWDLSDSDGLLFRVTEIKEDMTYTVVLKDQDQSWDSRTGREQSTISYQWKDLTAHRQEASSNNERLYLCRFKDLEATYRGKEKPDAAPIDLTKVRQFSVMVRSFFGEQSGPFSITFKSIERVESSRSPAESSTRSGCSMM